ncbi:MAG: nuclear transport factor 2 family protein [Acidobacteriota bacterium]|nr:nuclear transport factor 2 family protein [Acidobacteriota bacterium]
MRSVAMCAVIIWAAVMQSPRVAAQSSAAAEAEVRALIEGYNAAYARNDLDAYFRAFAPDLTQWFPSGRVDLPSYETSWRKYIGAGNRVEKAEVRDLRVQVGPSLDAAVATYLLRVTTRTADGEVSTEDNQETDVLFKREGRWVIVHLNYAPAPKPPTP